MADYSCEWCKHDQVCPYAYDQSDCMITQIGEAKRIADEEFRSLYEKLRKQNDSMCSSRLDVLLHGMGSIILDASLPIPEAIGDYDQ